MFSWLIAQLFTLFGWRIVDLRTVNAKKAIWVVSPHTTNFDFLIGLGTRAVLNEEIGFLAKSELFKWYSSWIFRGLGGYSVERKQSTNLVNSIAKTFQKYDSIHISIAPEGTRKDVLRLKSGFYYMALAANVPLILTCFSWKKKLVIVNNPISLTGEFQTDMQEIYRFFATYTEHPKQWLIDYKLSGIIPKSDSKYS